VVLHVFRVEDWEGEPHGLEGQPLEWVTSAALADYPMPAADRPVVSALRLPDICLITRPEGDEPESVLAHLERGLAAGVRLVQFRVFGLGEEGRRRLFEQVRARCCEADALLLCNSAMGINGAEADGLHLSARDLYRLHERPAGLRWLAASCHSLDDLRRAEALGADFALLSPVLPTPSHPDAAPLGWTDFAQAVEAVNLPIYALGGMRPDLREIAWRHGAQGIAGIRGIVP
jgi:8-oxo-dGTP diphosphatase